MATNQQLAQQLETLRRDFAQYRVETALRFDKLERRVDEAEGILTHAGFLPIRTTFATEHPSRYGSVAPRLVGHRRHPLPLLAEKMPSCSTPPSSSYFQTSTHAPKSFGHARQSPRSAARPSKTLGSRDNAQYLPFAI